MIYEEVPEQNAIRQGDIFVGIPKINISFAKGLDVVTDQAKSQHRPWEEIINRNEDITVTLGITLVSAIVISQDCDATRARDITFCEIKNLSEIFAPVEKKSFANQINDVIIEESHKSPKWFYLPPHSKTSIDGKMAVDFFSTIRVPRLDLEQFKSQRIARLKEVAYEHFRERLSHFYHRYAWNEWYPLDKEEIKSYKHFAKLKPEDFYDWQK